MPRAGFIFDLAPEKFHNCPRGVRGQGNCLRNVCRGRKLNMTTRCFFNAFPRFSHNFFCFSCAGVFVFILFVFFFFVDGIHCLLWLAFVANRCNVEL